MMESDTGTAEAAPCAQCSRVLPIREMIRHRGIYICASCKPVFMQKLAEGAYINTGEMRWAGFWIRFAASLVDGLLMFPLSIAVQLALGLTFSQAIGLDPRTPLMWVIAQLMSMATGIAYEAGMTGRYGATLGKMACGIRVVMPDGSRISYGRSFGRYFAKLVSIFTLYIGFIMTAFDGQKRGLHDRICNTRVVYK